MSKHIIWAFAWFCLLMLDCLLWITGNGDWCVLRNASRIMFKFGMKITPRTKASKLKDGMKVRGSIGISSTSEINEGVITIQYGDIFVCQDKIQGVRCKDRKGYKYTWLIGSEYDGLDNDCFQWLEVIS